MSDEPDNDSHNRNDLKDIMTKSRLGSNVKCRLRKQNNSELMHVVYHGTVHTLRVVVLICA